MVYPGRAGPFCQAHRQSGRNQSEQVAGFNRNGWPESIGMGGRNQSEWVAGINRNGWPDCLGICSSWEKEKKQTFSDDEQELIRAALESSTIDDITEYGRAVHAEMDSLLTCARNGISCRGATLYSTTFPCHNCAKHIIASGIKRVVYVEPYPKSKALDFHEDSAFSGFRCDAGEKVAFEPFVGVGPRRFFDLFSMKQGSGFPLQRKQKDTGKVLQWKRSDGTIRMPMWPWNYIEREVLVTKTLGPSFGGENDEDTEHDKGQTGLSDREEDATGDTEGL